MGPALDEKFKEISWKVLKHKKHSDRFENRLNEVELLRSEVANLRRELAETTTMSVAYTTLRSQAEEYYDRHKVMLEKDHMDEIVAFDIDTGEIAGLGNTVREAYDNARRKISKEQFYFKRVGNKYLHRLS